MSHSSHSFPSSDLLIYAGLGALRTQGDEAFEQLVARGRSWVEERSAMPQMPQMSQIIEALMPPTVPTAPMVLQARRNSLARTELIAEFGLLTGAEVADLNQSRAENRAALASRWKGEGGIFAVTHQGRDYFPGFQFEPGGRPRPVIADVLEALGGAHGWQTALWFTGANGYLDDRRPVDLLDDDSAAVLEAARREGAEVYF